MSGITPIARMAAKLGWKGRMIAPATRGSCSGPLLRWEPAWCGWGAPQPVAGPREAGAEADSAEDGDRPERRCHELGQAEAEQVQGTADRDEETGQPGNRRSPGHG